MAQLKVDKVVFVKQHAWYLSIVQIKGKPACFWSHHTRTGMTDEQAKHYFEKQHYAEVIELTKQHLTHLNTQNN